MVSARSLALLFTTTFSLSSVLAAPVESTDVFDKRVNVYYANCEGGQPDLIYQALSRARTDVTEAAYQMARVAAGNTESLMLYKAYFGPPNSSRIKKVTSNIEKTKNNINSSTYRFDCKCTEDTATLPNVNKPFEIKLCKRFWDSPLTVSQPGAVSKASLLRSDLFRFKKTAGVGDFTKGVSGVASIAKSNPDKAINNADSYALFAEKAGMNTD